MIIDSYKDDSVVSITPGGTPWLANANKSPAAKKRVLHAEWQSLKGAYMIVRESKAFLPRDGRKGATRTKVAIRRRLPLLYHLLFYGERGVKK